MIERTLCPILVGRREELSAIEDALLEAARGDGRVLLVSGDAGLGKTRLATEARRRAAKLGCTVLWGGCAEAELSLPYLPFLEAIGNHLHTIDAIEVGRQLGPNCRELARLFPQLTAEPTAGDGSDTAQAKLRVFEGIVALLHLWSEQNAVLIVVEDLHWADASTRELLDYLTRRVRSLPVMILATYRRDEIHRRHPFAPTIQSWRRARLAETVELTPLSTDGTESMIRAIFDTPAFTADFLDYLHQRSEGNPFVLEEMLKEAIDSGAVYRTDRGWEQRSIAELRLPRAVSDTVLMRIERLDVDQVTILQTASVMGRNFDYATIAAMAELPLGAVRVALEACVSGQLIEVDPADPRRFRYRHALTQEAVYEELIPPRREELHSHAADVLQEAGAAAVDIAHHLFRAGRGSEAAPLWLQAADAAMSHYAADDAAALYKRAMDQVSDPGERARVMSKLAEALL